MTERALWPDLLKALAIFLVVLLHVFPVVTPTSLPPLHLAEFSTAPTAPITLTIASTPLFVSFFFLSLGALTSASVPLFVMASGALLLDKQESYRAFLSKRLQKVGLPWVVWTLVLLGWSLWRGLEPLPAALLPAARLFFRHLMTDLWFLPLIFSLYLLTPLLRIFVARARRQDFWYALGLWFLFISCQRWLRHYAQFEVVSQAPLVVQFLGYFLLGIVLKKSQLVEVFSWRLLGGVLVGLLSGVGLVAIVPLLAGAAFDYFLFTNFIVPSAVGIATAVFLLALKSERWLQQAAPLLAKRLIRTIGKLSFGVYLVHQLLADVLEVWLQRPNLFTAQTHALSTALSLTFILYLASASVVFLLQKIPLIRPLVP